MRAALESQELYFKQKSSKWKYSRVIPSLPLLDVFQMTQPLTGLSPRDCKLAEVEGRDVNCLDLEMGISHFQFPFWLYELLDS